MTVPDSYHSRAGSGVFPLIWATSREVGFVFGAWVSHSVEDPPFPVLARPWMLVGSVCPSGRGGAGRWVTWGSCVHACCAHPVSPWIVQRLDSTSFYHVFPWILTQHFPRHWLPTTLTELLVTYCLPSPLPPPLLALIIFLFSPLFILTHWLLCVSAFFPVPRGQERALDL